MKCESIAVCEGDSAPIRRPRASDRDTEHLQSALAAMEQTIGVIGHDLRTPLSGILVLSEYLLSEDLPATAQSFIRTIHQEVLRLSAMVNNMLEAARLNSGAARWQWAEVDLAQVCHSATRIVDPLVDGRSVVLTCDPMEPIIMRGDEDALIRLVVNLLSNAQKNTKQGAIHLSACRAADRGRPWAEVRVSDTGRGIRSDIAGRLGVPFALNAGLVGSDGTRGAGLGLAICKGIAAAHGGSISLTSTPGKGTVASVRLRTDLAEPAAYNVGNNLFYEEAA